MDEDREPPSLQQLVLGYGTFDKIPPGAWQAFSAEMAEWKAKVRYGELGYVVDQPGHHGQTVRGKT